MGFGLGGFAETESVVDGDFEAFNFCLADQYYDAFFAEEWDLLVDINRYLIEKIIFWLSYDKEIVADSNYDLDGISNGTLFTSKGRTLIDAIYSDKRLELAETYIRLGVRDIRLYVLFMLYYKDKGYLDCVYKGTILNAYIPCDRDDLLKFLSDIFIHLDELYQNINDLGEKSEFLSIVKDNLSKFKYSKDFKIINLNDVCNSVFVRVLINK